MAMNKAVASVLLSLFFIAGCSNQKGYGIEEAIEKGDVVSQDKAFNTERLEQFTKNLSINKEDAIRVTGYTVEGDPIFQDLQFDGKFIHYSHDNSNDKFGGENTGIETDTCTKVVEEENIKGEIDYLISGCSKNPDNSYFLIRVEKNKLK
jgi:PBP1b-binding outer membrane lipoprotein LpoB